MLMNVMKRNMKYEIVFVNKDAVLTREKLCCIIYVYFFVLYCMFLLLLFNYGGRTRGENDV